MKKEEETAPVQANEHPGEQPVALNPDPRANENLAGKTNTSGEETVGSEITDGEDA